MSPIQQLKEQIASTKQLLREYEAKARASPDDFSLELSVVSLRERLSDLERQLGEENALHRVSHKQALRFSRPPGGRLRRFANISFSKKTFTEVLEPTLSDMQKEYFDALASGDRRRARWTLIRGYWAFWSAVIAQLPISLGRRIHEIWKAATK